MKYLESLRPRRGATRRRAWFLVSVASVVTASSLAWAAPGAPSLDEYLLAFDSNPSAAELESVLGAEASEALVAAARDAGRPAYARSRALTLLDGFPYAQVAPQLADLADDAQLAGAIRARALYTWIRHDGFRDDSVSHAAAWAVAQALLASEDTQARKTAALAVGWIPGSDAERTDRAAVLRQRRSLEADRLTQAYYDKALERMGAGGPSVEVPR